MPEPEAWRFEGAAVLERAEAHWEDQATVGTADGTTLLYSALVHVPGDEHGRITVERLSLHRVPK